MNTTVITNYSPLTGKLHEMTIPMSREQFTAAFKRWQGDRSLMIQDAFPTLNADQREFIMTGITPEEWDAAFGEKEDT